MTRAITAALLYVAFALGANPVLAQAPDRDTLLEARLGDMRKLAIHEEARPLPEIMVLDGEGTEVSLASHQGKTLLVNFWATWCAPCRKEMPELNALQKDLGGDDFEVVLIAVGLNPDPAIRKFFDEAGIDALETLRDPKQDLARQMGVFGLPVTVLINAHGMEVARLQGDADWHSEPAVDFLRLYLNRPVN